MNDQLLEDVQSSVTSDVDYDKLGSKTFGSMILAAGIALITFIIGVVVTTTQVLATAGFLTGVGVALVGILLSILVAVIVAFVVTEVAIRLVTTNAEEQALREAIDR